MDEELSAPSTTWTGVVRGMGSAELGVWRMASLLFSVDMNSKKGSS